MATQVYPRLDPRIIKILSPATEITMQTLVNSARTWEDEPSSMSYPKLITASGKQNLGGGVTVGITVQLENTKLMFESRTAHVSSGVVTSNDATGKILVATGDTFITKGVQAGATIINFTDQSVATVLSIDSETQITHEPLSDGTLNTWTIGDVYKIWNEVQCEATGGNLTAVDSSGVTMSPILPSAFTQIVKTSSSSATLSELSAIQYGLYNGGITIDVINGTGGTTYPIGTDEYPVNNLVDAKTIATDNGFNVFYILGDFTIGATDVISGYKLIGEGQQKTTVTLTSGCTTTNTHFESMSIQGEQKGETYYNECEILTLTKVHCQFHQCAMKGPITMHPTWTDTTQIVDCYNGNDTITPCIINHNNGKVNMRFSKYTGGIKFINVTNPTAEFSLAFSGGGRLELDASDTAGNMRIYGNVLVEGTYGLTLEDKSTGDVVWKHGYEASEYPSGTFGNIIGKKLLTIGKFLGLR